MSFLKDKSSLAAKDEIINYLKSVDAISAEELISKCSWLSPKDTECKAIIDQAFREYLLQIISSWNIDQLQMYIRLNMDLCRLELSTASLPSVLLSDIFDMSTLKFCEKLFSFVEMNVYTWKEDLFFTVCKNNLLRMCNDLLRRLSRSQNTVFCGRILLFLAQFFPFSERSGLNIVSEFNIENITEFTNDGDLVALMDEELEENPPDSKIRVDFSLYSKFWYLQNFFRSPNDLYTNQKWMVFTTYAKFVLTALQNYKLESGGENAYQTALNAVNNKENRYFAKFLTSQKLLELQLSDSNFRRYVLIQFLILFQYLTSSVKSKPDFCTLKPEQSEWINVYRSIVYELIEETPPDGVRFLNTVQKMLQREERWNEWKNKSCPEIKKPITVELNFENLEQNERYLGDTLCEFSKRRKYYLGNKTLTTLWNSKPDNLEACKSADRNFLPSLDDYFKIAVEESDPAAQIEPHYKKVNDIDYAWRGLRLLSQKCPHFFVQNNNPIPNIAAFLESTISKILTNKPIPADHPEEKVKVEPVEVDSQDVIINNDGEGVEEGEVTEDNPNDEEVLVEGKTDKKVVSKELLDRIAPTIVKNWQELGLKMGYQKDEIDFLANERRLEGDAKPTEEQNARHLLQIWFDDDDDPTIENLLNIVESFGVVEATEILKSL